MLGFVAGLVRQQMTTVIRRTTIHHYVFDMQVIYVHGVCANETGYKYCTKQTAQELHSMHHAEDSRQHDSSSGRSRH